MLPVWGLLRLETNIVLILIDYTENMSDFFVSVRVNSVLFPFNILLSLSRSSFRLRIEELAIREVKIMALDPGQCTARTFKRWRKGIKKASERVMTPFGEMYMYM